MLLKRYQKGLETKMEGSNFVFESVNLLYYSLHKISLNRGGSYIDSPDWIKHKKATINPKSKDNKCLRDSIIAALNHEKIKNHPERISNFMPFIDQYNLKGIDFPSHSKDWKKFEQNNKTIALNILYVPYSTKQIRQAYISKYNHKRENQVILLMITDGKKWHYLAVKNISALFRGITSNHNGYFYFLNCLHSYRTKETLKKHEKVCKDHDYCCVKMPSEFEKISKYKPGEMSLKVPFMIYADLECLIRKIDPCQNDPKKSCTEKKANHKPSGYSWITCCSSDKSKNE